MNPTPSRRCILTILADAVLASKQSFGAVQDLEAVKSVQQQLEGFQQEMERDGRAQHNEARKLVSAAIKRAQKLVDSTLQVVCLSHDSKKKPNGSAHGAAGIAHTKTATNVTSLI